MSEKVDGILVEKVVAKLVVEQLRKRKLSVAGTLQIQLARLSAKIKAETPEAKSADCTICLGICSVDETRCPYCGDGEADLSDPATVIAPGSAGQITPSREQQLDAAVAEVHRLKVDTVRNYWQLGVATKSIYDKGLWKERTDDRGLSRYKSWQQFAEVELGFAPQYVFKLMDVAAAYSQEVIAKIGHTKLSIVVAVPKEMRGPIEKKAKAGASAAELRADAKKLTDKSDKRKTGRDTKGGAAAHKPGAAKGGRLPSKVTVASLIGRVEIPLYATGKKKKAKVLSDSPTGEEVLLNGVVQTYLVTKNEAGDLILVVERRRDSAK